MIQDRERLHSLRNLVGNTPLLAIDLEYQGTAPAHLRQGREPQHDRQHQGPHGPAHPAQGYERGVLEPGAPIAEATSGNTGISFAALGRAMGHPVTIFMPDWMSQERKDLIRSLGAEIRLVSKEEGGFLGSIRLAEGLGRAQPPDASCPRQFSNEDNPEAHATTTGPEIWWQLRFQRSEAGRLRGRGRAPAARSWAWAAS